VEFVVVIVVGGGARRSMRRCSPEKEEVLTEGGVISHKYRGPCVAFSISKSVEPNEELKVG
jgi:hypothetical protein